MSAFLPQRFLVLGSGSWGTALAIYLARLSHSVILWGHNPEEMSLLQKNHTNDHYLKGVDFPPGLTVTSDLKAGFELNGADGIIFIVVPSNAFDEVCQRIRPFLTPNSRILWGTKGLSHEGELLHVVVKKYCGPSPFAVLSGPSFAKEVALGLPTAVTIATPFFSYGEALVQAFHSNVFRVYLSQDLIGVQLGGAVKNVLAIAVGMSDGLGFGANARCALITRGLAELYRLGEKLGAKITTMMGLSGVGDIVLTCTDNQSRNRRFGVAIGQGEPQQRAEQTIGQVVEGKLNVKQVIKLAGKHGVEMPICQQVHDVIYHSLSPQKAVKNLLERAPKSEGFP